MATRMCYTITHNSLCLPAVDQTFACKITLILLWPYRRYYLRYTYPAHRCLLLVPGERLV